MNTFVRIRKPAILLVILVVSLGLSSAARVRSPVVTPGIVDGKTATPAQPTAGPEKPATDYKSSLKALSDLYQDQATKLEKQNDQLKQLFKDGLISRVELEKSDKD